MATRVCSSCGEAKSVAGVWYLVDPGSDGFVCGTCFARSPPRARPGPA